MNLKRLSILIFAVAVVCFFPAWAQDEFEYALSIEEYLDNALPPQEGRIINYNEVTGILVVTDTPSNQRLIRTLIRQFDVGPKQIMIEAKFVEITFEDLNELGIEWHWFRPGDITIGSAMAGTAYSPEGKGMQWDADSTTTFPQSDFGLDMIISQYESGKFLTAYLKALASEDRVNLLSSPKVTTLSGQMANIQVTRTIPYVSDVDFENSGTAEHPIWQFEYTIEERITGITLEVTPYVSENSDIITLEIHPEVSNLKERRPIFEGAAANIITSGRGVPQLLGWPVIDTRTAQTSVMVRSGGTVIMGGFVSDDETVEKKKVPFLGDIPLIGNLFKYEYKTRTKKNLVIFLTATLVTSEGETAVR